MSRTDHHHRQHEQPGRRWWESSPPAWFIRRYWTGPDRRAVRDTCRTAVAEHRAGNEPETEPPTWQHRHGATWVWN